MSNPFQEQLLKAGVVTKQQVKKAQQDKKKKVRQQRATKEGVIDEAGLKAKQSAQQKAVRDRELNRKKEEEARKKAVAAEIRQLITDNAIVRDNGCEIAYNFNHKNRIKTIHVNEGMRQQLVHGTLGIAILEGRYELVPVAAAEKIRQRDAARVILLDAGPRAAAEDDPYAEYQVPDDLIW